MMGLRFWMALLLSTQVVYGIRFYLEPGQKRCFTEDLPSNSKITGETWVSGAKGDMEIDVWVTTTDGKVLYHKRAEAHGKFSFHTPRYENHDDEEEEEEDYDDDEEDTYRMCVEHQQQPSQAHAAGTKRSIAFVLHEAYQGDQADKAATATDTEKLEHTMRNMHTTLSGIIGDLSQLQLRERKLTQRMEKTNGRVVLLAVFAIVVAFATSVVQYKYYQGYFKQKKLC